MGGITQHLSFRDRPVSVGTKAWRSVHAAPGVPTSVLLKGKHRPRCTHPLPSHARPPTGRQAVPTPRRLRMTLQRTRGAHTPLSVLLNLHPSGALQRALQRPRVEAPEFPQRFLQRQPLASPPAARRVQCSHILTRTGPSPGFVFVQLYVGSSPPNGWEATLGCGLTFTVILVVPVTAGTLSRRVRLRFLLEMGSSHFEDASSLLPRAAFFYERDSAAKSQGPELPSD